MSDTQVYEDAIHALMKANKAIRQDDLETIDYLRGQVERLDNECWDLHDLAVYGEPRPELRDESDGLCSHYSCNKL